jgi:DNA polymerase-3 subunit delta'
MFRETKNETIVTNVDQLDSIKKFVTSLEDARLEEMIEHLDQFRPVLRQNVNPSLIFIVIALRFSMLMRGLDPSIKEEENWKHIPAFV